MLLNNQNGGFLSQEFLFTLDSSESIYKIDDFDNDGDLDLYILDNYYLKIYLKTNLLKLTIALLWDLELMLCIYHICLQI